MAEFAYMNSWNSSIGTTSFFLMYGYYPEIRWEVKDNSPKRKVLSANDRVKQLQELGNKAAERLNAAVAA